MEDPRRFNPASCEQFVEVTLSTGTPLRGFIDRIDIAPTGEVRVVDYKTGKKPAPRFQDQALFQMNFYALVYKELHQEIPTQLKLMYLKTGEHLILSPTEPELQEFSYRVSSLWDSIKHAGETGEFPSRPSKLCGWCAHQKLCPEYGGTPPVYQGWPDTRASLS